MLKRLFFTATVVISMVALVLGGSAAFDWH
jgi:hypothetical protein